MRAKPRVIPSLTGSKDLQMVNITLRVLSRPDAAFLPEIYRTLGKDYDERVLPSIVNEVLKSVVAQFNASQLIVQRELVSKMIQVIFLLNFVFPFFTLTVLFCSSKRFAWRKEQGRFTLCLRMFQLPTSSLVLNTALRLKQSKLRSRKLKEQSFWSKRQFR